METIGWPELLVIGIVFILLFGTKKIPEAAKSLGAGIRHFKDAIRGESETLRKEAQEIQKEIEKV